ncbi:MAG: RsmB/NOP family class I SAM-dependent RNA methyltransferase [Candidatus Thorarchaeota archaeon]
MEISGSEENKSAIELTLKLLSEYTKGSVSMRELLRRIDSDLEDDLLTRGYVASRSLGVVRFLNTIDFIAIRALGRRNLSDLKLQDQSLLRLAIYENRWLQSRRSNTLAALLGHLELSKVVEKASNIDLRRKTKNMSPSNALGLTFSHPSFLVDTFLEHLGSDEAIDLMKHNNRPRDYFVRANALLNDYDDVFSALENKGVALAPEPSVSGLFRVVEGVNSLFSSDAFKTGRVIVQDKGSVIVGQALEAKSGMRVWDACAAPGMKTHLIWESMNRQGQLIATDINAKRLEVARRRCSTLGCDGVEFIEADASVAPVTNAGKIIIDAPCTSTGILRSHPSYKWRLNKEMLMSIMSIQNRILDGVLSAYSDKPGTEVVFATCSLLPHEGESQVDSAMARHPIELMQIPYKGSTGYPGFECTERVIRLFPHRDNSNGFFIARMRITA